MCVLKPSGFVSDGFFIVVKHKKNILFTYSKLWVVVVLRAMWMTVKKIVSKTDYTWYKTERSAD